MTLYPHEVIPSQLDVDHLSVIRENVTNFLQKTARICSKTPGRILDIGPQDYEGIRLFLRSEVVETLDIDPDSGCTYIGDICQNNGCLRDNSFDYVIFTEVLEHTLNPFAAISEIRRILKTGGMLFLSVPLNFRIHGPLPDCWRFTEHGLRTLLDDFMIVKMDALETPGRPLMPIHYTVIAQKAPGRRKG
ncbi:MAG: methyltransferase domain-containing protein [Thermodesulfobacteriota bacterium]|nr:methyltransferase domain-containing protein [Thermodesulfobacteriota bacterium]